MKKLLTAALVFGFATVTLSAHAGFGIPSTGSTGGDIAVKVANKAVNKGIESAINDKIAKQGCAFKDSKTKDATTCDLGKIISDLSGWRSGLESTISSNVSVNIEASANKSDLAWDRVSYVQDKLRAGLSSWRWNTHKTTSNGDKLRIWVSVN
ncbi:MAG: hypothetical protein ACD_73C00160G0002 [uncultured bacterium]|nr:MAG: hypothetical protein ACD_73C00160G0002 [uncultured bacterium]